jgi:predicted ArsR family transcriptional regulator
MHPNGVRLHLERMLEAGLLERERPRHNVGRPRDMWSIAPGARPGGDPPRAYADLGRWLTLLISAGKTSRRAVVALGREIGRDLAPKGSSGSGDAQMQSSLAALGFAPEQQVDATGVLSYRLCNCPYRAVARENQDIVCTLHRGVTRGLLDVISPETKLAAFVPRDPDTAGCLIEVRGALVDEALERGSRSVPPAWSAR